MTITDRYFSSMNPARSIMLLESCQQFNLAAHMTYNDRENLFRFDASASLEHQWTPGMFLLKPAEPIEADNDNGFLPLDDLNLVIIDRTTPEKRIQRLWKGGDFLLFIGKTGKNTEALYESIFEKLSLLTTCKIRVAFLDHETGWGLGIYITELNNCYYLISSWADHPDIEIFERIDNFEYYRNRAEFSHFQLQSFTPWNQLIISRNALPNTLFRYEGNEPKRLEVPIDRFEPFLAHVDIRINNATACHIGNSKESIKIPVVCDLSSAIKKPRLESSLAMHKKRRDDLVRLIRQHEGKIRKITRQLKLLKDFQTDPVGLVRVRDVGDYVWPEVLKNIIDGLVGTEYGFQVFRTGNTNEITCIDMQVLHTPDRIHRSGFLESLTHGTYDKYLLDRRLYSEIGKKIYYPENKPLHINRFNVELRSHLIAKLITRVNNALEMEHTGKDQTETDNPWNKSILISDDKDTARITDATSKETSDEYFYVIDNPTGLTGAPLEIKRYAARSMIGFEQLLDHFFISANMVHVSGEIEKKSPDIEFFNKDCFLEQLLSIEYQSKLDHFMQDMEREKEKLRQEKEKIDKRRVEFDKLRKTSEEKMQILRNMIHQADDIKEQIARFQAETTDMMNKTNRKQ